MAPDDHQLLLEMQRELRSNTELTKKVIAAFPGDDVEGHRRYHEAVIEWRELRNRVVRESLIKVAQGSALSGTCWIAYALWQAFKITVKQ